MRTTGQRHIVHVGTPPPDGPSEASYDDADPKQDQECHGEGSLLVGEGRAVSVNFLLLGGKYA